MIKDPLNTQETPYEILDIDVNTPMKEIHQALPRFMKKNKVVSKIAVAQDAIRKLKSIPDRIAFDITFYSLNVMDSVSVDSFCDIPGLLSKPLDVPVYNPIDYYTELYSPPGPVQMPEVSDHIGRIVDIDLYRNPGKTRLFMPFDITGP